MRQEARILDKLTQWINGTPKVFLNVGIGPSHNGSNREAEVVAKVWPDIQIIGFEPSMDLFLRRRPTYPGKLYPWGLWCKSGIQTMIVTPNKGHSSILNSVDSDRACSTELISCTTLDQIDCAIKCPDDIFLWMDIEGAELEALRGGHRLLGSGRVKWIALEVAHKPRRVGQPSENDISTYLSVYNFVPHRHYEYSPATHNILYTRKEF